MACVLGTRAVFQKSNGQRHVGIWATGLLALSGCGLVGDSRKPYLVTADNGGSVASQAPVPAVPAPILRDSENQEQPEPATVTEPPATDPATAVQPLPNLGFSSLFLATIPSSLNSTCSRRASLPSFPEAATQTGSTGPDNLTGTSGQDVILGLDGNDAISGGDGDDFLDGGAGDDQISGGEGSDLLVGGEGKDAIVGGNGNDAILGGPGDDDLSGEGGNDFVSGGGGNDRIQGGEGDDIVRGDEGDDVLNGNQGNDLVQGGLGDDVVHGGQGDDCVQGNEGNDTLFGGGGFDLILGGDGDDILHPNEPDCRKVLANPSLLPSSLGWCRIQEAEGLLDQGRCTDPTFASCGQDWLSGGPGSDTYVVREGDGRVVVQADNLGTNSLVCETTSPVQVSDEGPDRIIRGTGFLIKLEGVNTPGASAMNNFRCK